MFNKETVSSINENSQEEESSQEQQTHEQETSAEGLTLKELPSHLKYEFLEPEKRKPVIISTALTEAEEQKFLVILKKIQGSNQEEFKVKGQRLKHYLGEKQLENKPIVLNEEN